MQLFFLVPDIEIISDVVAELRNSGVDQKDIHVMGDMSNKLKLAHIPEANILQTTHVIPAIKRGAMFGLLFSAVLGVIIFFVLPENLKIHPAAVAGVLLLGLLFGVWSSSLVGMAFKNPIVEKYQNYAKAGHFLLIIDARPEQENNIIEVTKHYSQISVPEQLDTSKAYH